jgi:7-carboxy-7-deazaguanine synthase
MPTTETYTGPANLVRDNAQPVEPQTLREDGLLNVVEVFDTIQGEGPFAGMPAVFVRLAGCNLQCPRCDTDYTSRAALMSPAEVFADVQRVAQNRGPRKLVVITGGEPFRQNITPLAEALVANGRKVQIETNGCLYLTGFPYDKVTVVCCPKTPKIHPKMVRHVSAWKYVVAAGQVMADGLPASSLGMPHPPARPDSWKLDRIYVQPLDAGADDLNAPHVEQAKASCLKHGYRLCLQTHKLLGLP